MRASDVLASLLKKELIDPRYLVEGEVRVSDVSFRNMNFRVECEPGPSYLVKLGVGAEKRATIAHEAAVYRTMDDRRWTMEGSASIGRYVPRLFGFDAIECGLIVELLAGGETLADRHRRTGRFSAEYAREVGLALAALHSIGPEDNPALYEALERSPYGGTPHWILSVHRPYLREIGSASNANVMTLKIIQRFPEFGGLLDGLRVEWEGGFTNYELRVTGGSRHRQGNAHVPVHCDIKWSNVLVHTVNEDGRSRKRFGVKLVDWELARLGDPCWDVGSFLGEYLTFWLLSIPVTGQDPPDRFLELARYPLDKMRPAMRAFWAAYVEAWGLREPLAHDLYLLRSVRYAAARLVQTAYEQGQVSALLTGNIIVLLQLALNILQRPDEAALALLGIPLVGRGA